MGTKKRLLQVLEHHKHHHLSGSNIACDLGVSRNAIWKAVEALRAEGYEIEATTNKGYRLSHANDLLSPASIEHFLAEGHPFHLAVRKRVGSTNEEARREAAEGAAEGTVIVAEEQSAGKGRSNKPFYSPAATGIYFSMVLRPELQADRAQYLTTAAAVACAQAIECVTGKQASIKWVNDIFVDGRKVAGILTEGTVDMESGCFEHAVLGIGMNVKPPTEGFPDDLACVAGAVCAADAAPLRSRLVAEVLTRFWDLYKDLDASSFYEEYRRRCFIIGSPVVVKRGDRRLRARAVGLTQDFKLVIELPDKTREHLAFGEVSTQAPPACP